MDQTEAIKQVIKRTLVIDNPQSIDEFTMPKIMKIIEEYVPRTSNAYPNTEAGGVVFCGKCGTAI